MEKKKLVRPITIIGIPLTYLSAWWLKLVRKVGINRIENSIFSHVGMLPIHDHYYQPLINPKHHLKKPLNEDRNLPGINFNDAEQLDLISQFKFQTELQNFPSEKVNELTYYYKNGTYESGDAEFLYNLVRLKKPLRIIEVGCGSSTLMIQNAVKQNMADDNNYHCEHICIEPYEQPWLEKLGIKIVRKKVEELDISFFNQLQTNDILFIDSSHIIRPQGDVLFEFLEVLPALNVGVMVHVHDVFTPKDYPEAWIYKEHRLWNEQYLLEAFLTYNNRFKIIGSLNYLTHHYKAEFSVAHPIYAKTKNAEPGAFWIEKI